MADGISDDNDTSTYYLQAEYFDPSLACANRHAAKAENLARSLRGGWHVHSRRRSTLTQASLSRQKDADSESEWSESASIVGVVGEPGVLGRHVVSYSKKRESGPFLSLRC